MSWTVIRASLQQRRTSLLWYCLGLATYSWFIVWYYPQFAGNDEFFEQIQQVFSNEMMAAFGAADLNFGTLGGFLGVEYLSLIWVIIVGAAVIGFAAKSIASEVENGTMDLTLTQPISRLRVALSRYVAMIIYAIAINLATVVPIWAACLYYDIEIESAAMPLLFAVGSLLTIAIGSFAFMVSAFSPTGGRVAAVSSGVLGAMWLANFISALNESTEFLDNFTIFHYWKPGGIIDEATTKPEAWWVFGIPAVLFAAIAIWRFVNRDVAA
jgi:ABC-2 type transport system permease protein